MADKVARMFDTKHAALFIDESAATHDDVACPLRVDLLRHSMQSLWEQRIVRVEIAPNVTRGQPEAFIERVSMAAIGLGNDLQMGIASQDVERLIRRATVDNNMFTIGVLLGKHTVDRGRNVMPLVERRGHDRDARPWFHM